MSLAAILILLLVATMPALAQDEPYAMMDDSWITISGTAIEPTSSTFILDYGDGIITVEMDDFDTYGDAYGLLDGDKVTVFGRIDDDLFENRTIEAGSVYVENLNTTFYANAADEEDTDYWAAATPVILSRTSIRGTVQDVDLAEREFTVDTGLQQIVVETELLGYNPLDDLGYQQIDSGDRVSVSGVMDADFLEGRRLEADIVTTLSNR